MGVFESSTVQMSSFWLLLPWTWDALMFVSLQGVAELQQGHQTEAATLLQLQTVTVVDSFYWCRMALCITDVIGKLRLCLLNCGIFQCSKVELLQHCSVQLYGCRSLFFRLMVEFFWYKLLICNCYISVPCIELWHISMQPIQLDVLFIHLKY